jgi:hypothetical protein
LGRTEEATSSAVVTTLTVLEIRCHRQEWEFAAVDKKLAGLIASYLALKLSKPAFLPKIP